MDKRSRYNWHTIQEFYDNGGTFSEITNTFGPCRSAIRKSFQTGRLINQRTADESAKISGRKATKPRDWGAIQNFYDSGNSWAKVTAKFGISSGGIQDGIKAGHLFGKTRTQALRDALTNKGVILKEKSKNCRTCQTILWKKGQTHYCSPACSATDRWNKRDLPRILEGAAGAVAVKNYLVKENPVCVECGQSDTWNGKNLTLHIDHINGDSDDNRLDNVRLLCPNCHSQTENFGIKNKGARSKRNKYMKDYRSS